MEFTVTDKIAPQDSKAVVDGLTGVVEPAPEEPVVEPDGGSGTGEIIEEPIEPEGETGVEPTEPPAEEVTEPVAEGEPEGEGA